MKKYFSTYYDKNYIIAEIKMMLKIKQISGLKRISCLQILRNKLEIGEKYINQKQKNLFIDLSNKIRKAKTHEDIKNIFY